MPKYRGTFTLEMTLDITALDLNTAQQELRAHVSLQAYPTKLISVIRTSPAADMGKDSCPDCAQKSQAPTTPEGGRPPRRGGPPPSGTPGAGTSGLQDQVEEFVFERAAA